MLIDDPRTRDVLGRIVGRLAPDSSTREDLFQEALVHLWLLEEQRPRQTVSWYLQNCQFFIRNYLASGRSVDAIKRRKGRVSWLEQENKGEGTPGTGNGDGVVVDEVCAVDTFAQLARKLGPREKSILDLLSQGLGAREIARRLDVSHPAVVKHRRRIASLAISLGIHPLPHNGQNGHARPVCRRQPARKGKRPHQQKRKLRHTA